MKRPKTKAQKAYARYIRENQIKSNIYIKKCQQLAKKRMKEEEKFATLGKVLKTCDDSQTILVKGLYNARLGDIVLFKKSKKKAIVVRFKGKNVLTQLLDFDSRASQIKENYTVILNGETLEEIMNSSREFTIGEQVENFRVVRDRIERYLMEPLSPDYSQTIESYYWNAPKPTAFVTLSNFHDFKL
jgi:hypothetical protein